MDHDCSNVTLPTAEGELPADEVEPRGSYCVHTWFYLGDVWEAGFSLDEDLTVMFKNDRMVYHRRGAWIPPTLTEHSQN
jgi:hypothetical protein